MKYGKKIAAFLAALMICLMPLNAYAETFAGGMDTSELEAYTDAYVEDNSLTTAAVSISCFSADEVIFDNYYGYTDIENKAANDEDTVMEWGSISKLLVWVSVMQQVAAGKIDLEEDIRTYLPEGFLTKLRYDTPVTMLDVMSHTGGWENAYPGTDIPDANVLMPLEEALRHFEPVQRYAPGTTVCYSNWSAALAGYIVSRVSGMDYAQYVRENIFAPCGMEHTSIAADLSDNEWVKEKRKGLKCYYSDNELIGESMLYLHLYPCGSATGTLGDLVRFAQALLNDGSLLSPLSDLYETSYTFPDGSARNAHGFWVLNLARDVFIHGGNMSGTSAMLALDIENGTGAVVMTNQAGEQVYCYDYIIDIFGGWRYTENASHDAGAIAGVYMDTKAIRSGYMKLDKLLCVLPFLRHDGDSVSVPLLGSPLRMVDDGKLILDYSGTDMLVYLDEMQGQPMISTSSLDYVRLSTADALMMAGSLVLLLLTAIISFVSLICDLIRLIRRKARTQLSVQGSLLKLACMLTFADLILIYALGSAGVEGTAITVLSLFSIVFCVAAVWYAAKAIRLKTQGKHSAKALIKKTPIFIAAVAVILNVVYWQMYMFW